MTITTNAPEKIDWFTQTITDNGSGKSNWFQLDEYMGNLEKEASKSNFLKSFNNSKINSFFYRNTLKKHSDQLRHNLQTVWGGWIKHYNDEKEEISEPQTTIMNIFNQGVIENIRQEQDYTSEMEVIEKTVKELEMKEMIHNSSTWPIYRMFCLPTIVAVKAIEKKDWAKLEEAVKYKFDMTYI